MKLVSEESTGRSLERQERVLRARIRNFSAGDRLCRRRMLTAPRLTPRFLESLDLHPCPT